MTEFNPIPPDAAIESVRNKWKEETDTFGRIYRVILGTTEFTHYPEIAELANCADNSAKKHLDRLVEMGLVKQETNRRVACYRRNNAYFEWLRASQIADDLAKEEITERVHSLEIKKTELEDEFHVTDPLKISIAGEHSHDTTHERLKVLSEWRVLERDIQLYEFAFQLVNNDGHLISS